MPRSFFPHLPTLAFTASSSDFPARLRWVEEHAHAVEFSPDPEQLDSLPRTIGPFLEAGLTVRFHTRYFKYELGHVDEKRARAALDVHMRTLSAMAGLGGSVVTVHTGLDPGQPVQSSRIVENLSLLVEFAEELSITVCLENLRMGHSSDPRNVLDWAAASGAKITLDIGHALGAECVRSGMFAPKDFVELFSTRLHEVHIYGKEDSHGHHPITDMKPIEPVIEKLLQTGCSWWTVELQEPDEAISTRALLEVVLQAKKHGRLKCQADGHTFSNRERPCTTSA